GEQGGEGARRVGDGAAEGAAVQVGAGAVDVDLAVGEAAHAHAHRRGVRTPHGGVGDDDDIAGQPGAVAGEQVREVRGAGFFLAFDQEFEGDRRGVGTGDGQVGAESQGVEEDLSFVVGSAAADELVSAHGGGERVGEPRVVLRDRFSLVATVGEDGGGHRGRG